MAENENEPKVDTLGIPLREKKVNKEASFIDEVEDLADSHIPFVLAIFYTISMVAILLLQLDTITLFDFIGAIIAGIFIMWTGGINDTYPYYQYLSMTVMFAFFILFQFLK